MTIFFIISLSSRSGESFATRKFNIVAPAQLRLSQPASSILLIISLSSLIGVLLGILEYKEDKQPLQTMEMTFRIKSLSLIRLDISGNSHSNNFLSVPSRFHVSL